MDPEVRYAATADGVSIAYHVQGSGPALIMLPILPISHLQAELQVQGFRGFLERLGERRTVIRYDARGLGLSDRKCSDLSLEAHLLDILGVLDRLRIGKCSIFAASYAGPIGIAFAARHPERVDRLMLWCTHSSFHEVAADVPESQRQARDAVIGLARVDPALAVHTYIHHATGWGSDENTSGYVLAAMKSMDLAEFFPRLDVYADFDASPCLGEVNAPTLVLHRPAFRGSHVSVARRLAARLPDARLLLLEGESVSPFAGDVDAVIRAIDEFLGHDTESGPALAERPLTAGATAMPDAMQALLVTDLEGHTAIMQRLGDDKGRTLLREHEEITRAALRAHGGRELKALGDGFMATFASVRGALDCAIALQRGFDQANGDPASAIGAASLAGTPVKVRIGVNAGEPLSEDDDLFGSSVIAVARIAAQAAGGEILVADVVRQLAAGKQFVFVDRGELTLRGFEEPIRLYELRWNAAGDPRSRPPARNDAEAPPQPATGRPPHQTVSLGERHGLDGLLESIERLQTAQAIPSPTRHQRPESLPAGLTAREAEVLALIARGLTNQEAADRLVLSVRTVERHIANIYTKIDAHTRAEATTFALRHGLS